MALSYEYSIGSVRAKETSLLRAQDIEQLLSCKHIPELCAVLNDKGYGDGDTVDEIIGNHMKKVWEYLKSVAPDFSIFDPFILLNDVHNFKVALKGTMSGREYRALMLTPCKTPHDDVVKAVENRKMSLMPAFLEKPCDRAYELLAHTGDARMSDAVLDSAVMAEMLRLSRNFGSEFLKNYFKTLVFYNNIKTAVRSARTGGAKDYLELALCEVEGFNKKDIIKAAVKGYDSLIGELSKLSAYDCQKAMESFKKSPSAFEKFVDDKLIIMAKESCKRVSEGAEPLLGYYLGCEAEQKVIHIIASGIHTAASEETIRERLREIYG